MTEVAPPSPAGFGAMDMFNVLNTFIFMVNTGFAFNDRIKAETLKRNGGTKVRIWAGQSRHNHDMTGHVPDFRTYNFDGSVIGTYHGKGKRIGAGGYVDIMIPNSEHHRQQESYYLKIFAGGDDGLCLSSIAMTGPNEFGTMFWPELLIGCGHNIINDLPFNGGTRNGFDDSLTMVAGRSERPKCVWFDRNFSFGLKLTELTIHTPDLMMAKEKAKEWHDNKEFFCRATPRILPAENHDAKNGFYDPIWTFKPVVKYNMSTGLELNPAQILNWTPDNTDNDFYLHLDAPGSYQIDFQKLSEKLKRKITNLEAGRPHKSIRRELLSQNTKSVEEQQAGDLTNGFRTADPKADSGFLHWISASLGWIMKRGVDDPVKAEEDLAMYNDARQLVVLSSSTDEDSATSRCTLRVTDEVENIIKRNPDYNPDYLSLDEGVYCDTVMTTMYSVCEDKESILCFDKDMLMLRRLEADPDPAWIDHDAAILEGSERHKKKLRRKRAVEAVSKIAEENLQASAKGLPIKYRLGEPRPLWNRPYHSTRVTQVDPVN